MTHEDNGRQATEVKDQETHRGGQADLNPFDPERLRVSQDYGRELGVKELLVKVPIRTPSKEWWVRAHPDDAYQLNTALLELKEERGEIYLVDP